MKQLFLTTMIGLCFSLISMAETANVRIATGAMPNPQLAPLGQLMNVENGEVLYVNSVISVLTPSQLNSDCIYQINFTRSKKVKSIVQLVPPMNEVSCGHRSIRVK